MLPFSARIKTIWCTKSDWRRLVFSVFLPCIRPPRCERDTTGRAGVQALRSGSEDSNSTQTAVKIATQAPSGCGGGNTSRMIFEHFSHQQNALTPLLYCQLPVCAGCNQAQLTSTLPLALRASLSKAFKLVSKSSTSQPVQRSTTFKSTLRCALAPSLYLVARSIFPQRGFSLLLPPESVEDPAASKRIWERETMKSSSVLVTPQAPSPGW